MFGAELPEGVVVEEPVLVWDAVAAEPELVVEVPGDVVVPPAVEAVVDPVLPPLEDTVLVGGAWVPELATEVGGPDDPPFAAAVAVEVPVPVPVPVAFTVTPVISVVPAVPVAAGEFVDDLLGAPPGDEPDGLLLDGEPSEPRSPAWAMPAPLTKAAPNPSVIAPAPSHV